MKYAKWSLFCVVLSRFVLSRIVLITLLLQDCAHQEALTHARGQENRQAEEPAQVHQEADGGQDAPDRQ